VGLRAGGDGAEVGHEAEDALGLHALEGDGVAVGVDGNILIAGGILRFGRGLLLGL
jgi:hypothetical protein